MAVRMEPTVLALSRVNGRTFTCYRGISDYHVGPRDLNYPLNERLSMREETVKVAFDRASSGE